MTLPELSSFQCIACQPPVWFGDLPAVEEHFSSLHRVPHLLSSPATRAVALPGNLFCDRNSCPLSHHCCLCNATSKTFLGTELKNHMKTVHGEFFQHRLHHFSTSHCRLCGDTVECDGGEHKSSCNLGSVRWWKEEDWPECKEAEEPVGVKLKEGTQEMVYATAGRAEPSDFEERESKSEDSNPEANQEPPPCQEQVKDFKATQSIETLKVRKVVRKAKNSREACPQLKSNDQEMYHKTIRSQEEEAVKDSSVYSDKAVSKDFKHSAKIVVNRYESSTIIGLKGSNVKKLQLMTGARIEVTGGKGGSRRIVEIFGEKAAVEKAEEVVNGYLMRNCTSKIELCHQEGLALIRLKGKYLNLCRQESGAALYIDFQGGSGKSGELNICGSQEAVEKAKKWIEDFLENGRK